MAKSLQKIKSSLKLRTQEKSGALTLRLGVKKYVLPFEVRLLTSNDFVFVHVPPSAEIMKVTKSGLEVVTDADSAEQAAKSFRRSRKRTSAKASKSVEMPTELANALNKVPAGYKLAYGPDGQPRLVKTRRRRKKQG
ncbi:MAG: hypothetical protein JST30_08735 [Armatimonadetes bacterium]|nr:hypothetical protein [Armatimonadota bacterium]